MVLNGTNTLTGLQLLGTGSGSGVTVNDTATLNDMVIGSDDTSQSFTTGVSVGSAGTELTINDSSILVNSASSTVYGIYHTTGNADININANTQSGAAYGVYFSGTGIKTLDINNSSVAGTSTNNQASGVCVGNTSGLIDVSIDNSVISAKSDANQQVIGVNVQTNNGGKGAGGPNDGVGSANLNLTNSTVTALTGASNVYGVKFAGSGEVNMKNSTISAEGVDATGNTNTNGVSISSSALLGINISGSTITAINNGGSIIGATLSTSYGDITVDNSIFSASGDRGGLATALETNINSVGETTISNSTLNASLTNMPDVGNVAYGLKVDNGTTTLTDSLMNIYNDATSGHGYGVYNGSSKTVDVTDNTINVTAVIPAATNDSHIESSDNTVNLVTLS